MDSAQRERRRISLELPVELVAQIDSLRGEWGLRSRGDILVRLLQGLFEDDLPEETLEVVELSSGSWPVRTVSPEAVPRDTVGSDVTATETMQSPPEDLGSAADEAIDWTTPGLGSPLPAPGMPTPEPEILDGSRHSAQDLVAEEDAPEDPEDEEFSTALDERGSLVLVPRRQVALRATGDPIASPRAPSEVPPPSSGGSPGGIDLPGFVQRRSDRLRRSLRVRPGSIQTDDSLPTVPAASIQRALTAAAQHWSDLYGSEPNEAVLEAAMVWLAQDIWPHADQSEGRAFTWSLASALVRCFVPSWEAGPASFERVMVMAGLLEDPFSAATLELRLPTLIRRFVHRFRRRRPGTSFLTLEHTMTLHGALKLLQLPTAPGHQLSLRQIRESYREMAVLHHPDSGGSVDVMRRLNEAYHMLKELYRGSS
ncbi:molecular chaperone DnaJ [Synechococcus sp. CCY9202]|uniref:molecular chaperone DnaJ n=1 Tax=Synechococcus sp. CCY9202 TaxID=174698 RepID=UPI002B20BA82|nr:molecular chaperone DnaJ [Synechococcus sp. CCY9202]MEA5424406.1 molecular chaperone DnaJ [Synechococcus sp. CCY9202]